MLSNIIKSVYIEGGFPSHSVSVTLYTTRSAEAKISLGSSEYLDINSGSATGTMLVQTTPLCVGNQDAGNPASSSNVRHHKLLPTHKIKKVNHANSLHKTAQPLALYHLKPELHHKCKVLNHAGEMSFSKSRPTYLKHPLISFILGGCSQESFYYAHSAQTGINSS